MLHDTYMNRVRLAPSIPSQNVIISWEQECENMDGGAAAFITPTEY